MGKHHAKMKVGIIRHSDIRHMCESYCMVAAIHRTLKLVVKEHGYLEPEFPNPEQLRRIRENIFQKEIVPGLKSIHLLCPRDFSNWVRVYEQQKAQMMTDIDAIYAKAREVNERTAAKFLVYQRAAAVVGGVASAGVILLGGWAILTAIGASASLAAAGTATAEQVAFLLGRAKIAGVVAIIYNTVQGGVSVHRKMEEMEDAHLIAVVGDVAPGKVKAVGTEQVSHHVAEHTAALAAERNLYSNECKQILQDGSTKLANNAHFEKIWLKNTEINKALAKNVARGSVLRVGVVFCAGAELYETYEQFIEDWNAGTNHEGGHGHGEQQSHDHAHHL